MVGVYDYYSIIAFNMVISISIHINTNDNEAIIYRFFKKYLLIIHKSLVY